jgi:hypothetical protein
MNKKQWKAIYDYLEDLGEYPQDTSYESMMEWLTYA